MSKHTFSILGSGMLLATLIAAASLPAQATTQKTATFQVSLTVSSDCSISANALNFGSADSTLATTAITQSTSLSVTCSTGTPYTLSLDKGDTSGSTISTRLLAGTGSNTQKVTYQLYSDNGLSTIWGDGTTGNGSTVGGNGTGSAVSITVYGKVPAQPIPPADSYTATETATISF